MRAGTNVSAKDRVAGIVLEILERRSVSHQISADDDLQNVGLNAVFIPHEHTWRLEKEEVVHRDGRLLTLHAFGELRAHF